MSNANFKVDVSPEMQLYRILQRQSYEIGTAFAEFVDNSIQSFSDQRDAIEAIDGSGAKLMVRLDILPNENRIVIEDTAGGIDRSDFQRAIRIGYGTESTPDPASLSTYGIGMKSAAIWFSNRWSIETTALGSDEKLTTMFDLDLLLQSGETTIEVETSVADSREHYTRIIIDDCLRDLADLESQFRDVVLPYLKETFYKFENVTIEMTYDHLTLDSSDGQFDEPPALFYPCVDKDGNKVTDDPITWRVELDFTYDKKPVTGFVMIRDTGSYHGPGIRLLRNNRVISGTQGGGKQNKPEVLLGTTNKFAAQRIYGEIHLDEFPVNFMKTGFDINMDSLYREIKSRISMRSSQGDFVEQATNFRKKKASSTSTKSKTKSKKQSRTKPARPAATEALTEIRFSQDLNDALEKLPVTKHARLYISLCRISLSDDAILAYVGTWTLLESLATQMGKPDKQAFNDYYNQQSHCFTGSKEEWKNCKAVISDIHKKGNMNKHSGVYEAINAQQLASDFLTMDSFLTQCAEEIANAAP